ncbi:MAG: hypothetical protein KKA73_02690 [Chloroflexi bacterium]|nr:hypothetical protein [Chloroflexota bacterium]MBU1746575.1 hypothetical protein [Chloroflexota bacterium]
MRKTKISRLVSTVILAVLVIALWACTISSEDIPTISAKVLSAGDAYPLAWTEVQKWRSDAYLINIEAAVHYAEDPSPLYIFFDFDALNDPAIWLSVKCWKGENGFEARSETGQYTDPVLDRMPIHREDWILDSQEALDIAQNNGGNEFMYRRLDTKHFPSYFLKLERNLPPHLGDVIWRATYSDFDAKEGLDILIDANTGEVRKVEQKP